ncbi:MAG: hypothetical protein QXH91_02145 [Candidatus Bathyarchaeia archaeon]
MPSFKKWFSIGWLLVLSLGIIAIEVYTSKRVILFERKLKRETEEVKDEIKKLREGMEKAKMKSYADMEIYNIDWEVYRNEEYKFKLTYPSKLIKLHLDEARLYRNKEYYKGVMLKVELGNRHTGCCLEIYIDDKDLLSILENTEYILDYKILKSKNKTYYLVISTASHAVDPAECMSIFNLISPTFRVID